MKWPIGTRTLMTFAAAVAIGVLAAFTGTGEVAGAGEIAPEDVTSAALQHGAAFTDPARAGIWKAATPPSGSIRGEFDSNDPIGLASGVKIPADCSLNWKDPDFGNLYCFSSATSLVYFLNSPRAYLARARKNWAGLKSTH
jgi:hypothetical protein